MQNIDYASFRGYSIANPLKCEITSTSFYPTKDGFHRKHKISELATVVKKPSIKECLCEVPRCNKKTILEVDFMTYARKVLVKNAKLKTYGDVAKHLSNTITKFASLDRIELRKNRYYF